MATIILSEQSVLLHQQTAVVILSAIAFLVAAVAAKLKFPLSVGWVVAGLAVPVLGSISPEFADVVDVEVSPDLILALLVPPLLFEATLQLPWKKLKANLLPVLLLAIGGTMFGTVVIASLTVFGLDIPWAAAFAFGALISATDPVAVIAFFKSLGVPKRLTILVEGESLFNDAVAVVAFTLAVSAASGSGFSVGDAFSQFVIISAGGLFIGLGLGYVISSVFIAKIDDPMIETSLTLATAYGSFLLAEEFGKIVGREDLKLSGILAVVAAGLVVGNSGLHNTSPSTRITLNHFWELLTFLANSMVFLIIGITITPQDLLEHLDAILLAIIGVTVVRTVLVYGMSWLIGRARPRQRIPISFQHVMNWGGLRGAISLALALSVTDEYFSQEVVETVRSMTFGVVLFTLLLQGTTISQLIKKLGLASKSRVEMKKQKHQAVIRLNLAAQEQVDKLVAKGDLFEDMAESLQKSHRQDLEEESVHLREHFVSNPELEASMLIQARRKIIAAERSALSKMVRDSLVDSNIAAELAIELNNRVAALEILEQRWGSGASSDLHEV